MQPLPDTGIVQSRRRRQQVIPEPNPSSCSKNSHGIPVYSTNKMPHRDLPVIQPLRARVIPAAGNHR
jgi:hypothetical protein